jgi:hypothetical protein
MKVVIEFTIFGKTTPAQFHTYLEELIRRDDEVMGYDDYISSRLITTQTGD